MTQATSYTLKEIAAMTQSELIGDPDKVINGVESLECASESDASFLANPLYVKSLKKSKAGVVFVATPPDSPSTTNFLINANPSNAFQKVIELFYDSSLSQSAFTGVHETAIIHPTAQIASDVSIGPYAVIDQHTVIESGTQVCGQVNIGPHVKIGSNCILHSGAIIRENCTLKNHVIIQPGAVIGSCGFGYITDPTGNHNKLTHVGTVVIEDHVEIGANTTIDRGRFKETRIRSGVKIDNQVQVGHGVEIGNNSIIISQTGIAGSSKLGKFNVLAGQVGVVGHIELCDHVTVAARGAPTKSIKKPGRYGGAPAVPEDKFYIQQMNIRKLNTYVNKIRELEKKVEELQKNLVVTH